MAVSLSSYENADDDYIDMEVSSYCNFFSNSVAMNSPPHPREFEFQMSSACLEREPSTSPADELFYKGKLLPLHLPPRLQMVEKLLENTKVAFDQDLYNTPLATALTTPTTASTPFESCNISPSDSCQVGRELNLNEYFFEYSDEVSGFIGENQEKSWTKMLKLIKHSTIGSKLKASRAYFKSLFSRSGCSNESCTAARSVSSEGRVSKADECLNNYVNVAKKTPSGVLRRRTEKEKITEDTANCHRRSFSMVIKQQSTNKSSSSSSSSGSSSSSSSNDSTRFNRLQFLKRSSSSAHSELENSIQGAIAHCKQSQQLFCSRKTLSEVRSHSFSTTMITVCNDH
ncbi:probable membrane-associated kinase regulator 4 [Mangifera indica]|uniref:probable membrane-associated kinase regulator 4 n=1 Tax=Mangifera indica TaxID=29780 RepID=UPI001CFA2375|nr:probable membrane-associated kinase regulator 4 [Mangifera indica]